MHAFRAFLVSTSRFAFSRQERSMVIWWGDAKVIKVGVDLIASFNGLCRISRWFSSVPGDAGSYHGYVFRACLVGARGNS